MNVSVKKLELDATALKVMAHPMRVQMLRILELRQRASVTSLAEELNETTGATSYHLRQLARHGFVEQFTPEPEPEPEAGAKTVAGRKQQWWRMAVDQIHMTGFEFMANEDTREAASFVLRAIEADRSRRLANWFVTAPEWSETWQRASSDHAATLTLNAKQTRELADELHDVLAKYREAKPGRGARAVDVQYAVFPADTGERA